MGGSLAARPRHMSAPCSGVQLSFDFCTMAVVLPRHAGVNAPPLRLSAGPKSGRLHH